MDAYALGATMFKMLTCRRSPEASDILNDGFHVYELQERNITERTLSSIAKAMAPIKKQRYQMVADFIKSFEKETTVIDVEKQIRQRVMQKNKSKNFLKKHVKQKKYSV